MVSWPLLLHEFSVPLSHLPRETRLCVTLLGQADDKREPTLLAWATLALYDHIGNLRNGPQLLGLWQTQSPAPTGSCERNVQDDKSPLLVVALGVDGPVRFSLQAAGTQASNATPSLATHGTPTSAPSTVEETKSIKKEADKVSVSNPASSGAPQVQSASTSEPEPKTRLLCYL